MLLRHVLAVLAVSFGIGGTAQAATAATPPDLSQVRVAYARYHHPHYAHRIAYRVRYRRHVSRYPVRVVRYGYPVYRRVHYRPYRYGYYRPVRVVRYGYPVYHRAYRHRHYGWPYRHRWYGYGRPHRHHPWYGYGYGPGYYPRRGLSVSIGF